MSIDRRFFAIAAFAGLAACTGAPPITNQPNPGENPQQPIVADTPGTQSDSDVGAGEDIDVSPVKPPGEVVLHLRLKNPMATATTAASYAQLPANFVSSNIGQAVKELVRESIASKVDVKAFAENVNIDAPIDLVIVADMSGGKKQVPDPMVAISVGLNNLNAALSASKGKPKDLGQGVWEIGTQDKWGEPCAVAAAAGKAPARLVCGDRKKHVQKLAAFVSRNIAKKPDPPHDFRMEAHLRPILDKYGRQWANQAKGLPVLAEELKIGNAKFDDALMDAADALADEAGALIQDADSFIVDLGLDANKGAHMGVQMKFVGRKSWFVKTMTDGASKSGPPPAMTWRVPEDSEYVAWGRSGDPKRFDKILASGRAMLQGILDENQVGSAADRKAITTLLRNTAKAKHVATTFASGHFGNMNQNPTSITQVVNDVVGWYLIGFEEKPAETKKWFTDAMKVWNRKSLQKLMKAEMGSDAKYLPKVKKVKAPKGLGKALVIEVTFPNVEDPFANTSNPPSGNTKLKTVDIKGYVVVMGDGNRTWVGLSADKKELGKLMNKLTGKKTAGTLAARGGLSRVKSESHAGGALTSLEGIVGIVKPMIYALMAAPGGGMGGSGQKILTMLQKMPNQGKTPILMFADVTAGSAPTIKYSLTVPKGTLDDLGFLVTNALKMSGISTP